MRYRTFQLALLLLAVNSVCQAQPSNLLQNPNATGPAGQWRAFGEATTEPTTENNVCFVVRNGGYFFQDVDLPEGAAGQYALLIGRGSSERINADGAITGLPYLYGYMMENAEGRIREYLEGQQMRAQTDMKDQWVKMWGIFKVAEGTTKIRFFLNQALGNGVPHNGSAARFDDLGLYLFTTKAEAQAFVVSY